MKTALLTIEKSESLSGYLLGSVILHVAIFIWMLAFMDIQAPEHVPSTEITFLRLTKVAQPVASQDVIESPENKNEAQNKTEPVVKKIETTEKKQSVADLLKEKNKQVILPDKNKKIEKKTNPVIEKNKTNTATNQTKTKEKAKVDNSQIKNALAGIDKQLNEREKVSNGNGSPYGTQGGNISADDPGIAAYRSAVKAKVVRNLRWPGGASDTVLITKISFRLSPSGGLISASFAKRSNNGAFDEACMRAVQAASPFPPPPEGAITQGFLVEFRKRL